MIPSRQAIASSSEGSSRPGTWQSPGKWKTLTPMPLQTLASDSGAIASVAEGVD